MPQITPIVQEGTLSLQANTQMPSAKMAAQKLLAQIAKPSEQTPPPQEDPGTAAAQSPSERKAEKDPQILKARLFQEKLKQQLMAERKKIDAEKRELEIVKASSRKWQEASELAAQGRYIEAAERAGLTYDQMTQQILNGGTIPPQKVAETVAAQTASDLIKKELQALRQEQIQNTEVAQKQQYQEALSAIQNEVKYTAEKSDKFLLAKTSEAYDDVTRYIESEYHRTGQILPVEEALTRWEEEALKGLEELLSQDSLRKRVLKEPSEPVAGQSTESSVPKTLNQRAMSNVPSPRALTDQERRQRAIDAFHGRLLS